MKKINLSYAKSGVNIKAADKFVKYVSSKTNKTKKSVKFKNIGSFGAISKIPNNFKKMIAGNIQFDDDIEKFKKICNYIDISGGIESSGVKDISKIDIFLNKIKKVNDEN